ncbi:Carnitine O-acyltransferase [Ectocarpus siliculosus]|uniref:Carnitine O-acyltransferase n=1 Tax=Ectocarpus siliculosus TaxID=2880 RepID=D8LBB6_ECTSI|nr:Carnitine O-acyltransferase [Ectocarpus siliculosus]|eukprot:CBN76625.1 Carnitine O-acyltransferase [Ectocarpus siliculosus]
MHQSRLPKLQVPPLGDTLGRYLGAVAPLLSPEAFAVTKGVVQEFETSGEGEALQRSLLEYAAEKDSFVEEFWDDSYLTPKSSVVLNLNPFFVFETPTLSTHSKDLGDEIGDAGACSSCGAGGGSEDRSRFPSPPRRSANGGIDVYDDNASRPSFYRSPPHKRGDRRSSEPASRRAARDTGRAAVAGKKQARRAASLLYSSLRFASAVRSETLPPDLWRDTPLCMAQYRRLFGAHRKAVENDADEMRVCEDSRHVVVLCKNQFYCFSALHPDGRVGITEEELEEIVLAVQEDAAKANLAKTAANAVGVLTTQTRDDWAVARRRLAAADETNKRYLHLVDTALFVLCLDHTSPCTSAEIAASCLHGSYALEGDVQVGTCTNRWYDKLQLIVFENGAAGVNFEHTWVDGHTVLRFASDVFADVIYRFANHLTSTTGGARGREGMGEVFPPDKQAFSLCDGRSPVKMEWRLPKDMRRDIYFAETRISDLIRQHDVQALEYDTFGKRFITQNKMSPDAFVQMSIVYGYYGLYGDVVAAYEPVLTKAFLKGRTEALRTVTAEVKAFLEAFSNPDTSTKRKMLSLRTAIVSHGRLVKLAAKGKGVDRHLFALLCMAKKKAEEATAEATAAKEAVPNGGDSNGTTPPSPPSQIPALFEDEAWRVLNHVILSTSNCGNPSLRLFGFGPVVRDGFGVGYIIKENQLKLVVTSKNRQTDRFVGKIREFFDTVFHAYSPSQIQGRVRVVAAEGASDESGGYSMWGSFRNKKGDALL